MPPQTHVITCHCFVLFLEGQPPRKSWWFMVIWWDLLVTWPRESMRDQKFGLCHVTDASWKSCSSGCYQGFTSKMDCGRSGATADSNSQVSKCVFVLKTISTRSANESVAARESNFSGFDKYTMEPSTGLGFSIPLRRLWRVL